jgi:hypothetical protein
MNKAEMLQTTGEIYYHSEEREMQPQTHRDTHKDRDRDRDRDPLQIHRDTASAAAGSGQLKRKNGLTFLLTAVESNLYLVAIYDFILAKKDTPMIGEFLSMVV